MGFENPVVGGTSLRIPAIQSPNYSAGSAGWIIKIDGSAEFNNLTIRGTFLGADFIMNSDGLFIYAGTPAAGNLIANITAASGVDTFGNTYLAGINTYAGSGFVGLNVGNLLLGLTASAANAGLLGLSGSDTVFASSPVTNTETDAATWALVAGLASTTPQSSSAYPHLDIGASSNGLMAWLHGAMLYATASGGVSTAETWHTPTFTSPWASTGTLNGNSTFRGMQYRRDAEDNVWVLGAATTTGAGSSIFTLPAGYRPPANNRVLLPCYIFDSSAAAVVGGFAQVTEAGVVNVSATLSGVTTASGDQVFINGKVPLGNVG
jgi:hypothetical protein